MIKKYWIMRDDQSKSIENILCKNFWKNTLFFELEQCVVAIEELSELQKEICKWLRNRSSFYKNRENLKEELADVLIVCKELQLIFKIDEKELEDEIDFKIERTLERIKND